MGVIDREARLVDPLAQVIADAALTRQLLEQRPILGRQPELSVDPLQPDPTVTADQFAEVGRQVGGNGEFGIGLQRLDHRVGGHAGGGGVPERQRGQAVGVDVFGALLDLREWSDRVAGLRVQRVVDLE